jgi:hypothetical protein
MNRAFTLLQIAAGLFFVALLVRRMQFDWFPGVDNPDAKIQIRRFVLIGLFSAGTVTGVFGAVLLCRVFAA